MPSPWHDQTVRQRTCPCPPRVPWSAACAELRPGLGAGRRRPCLRRRPRPHDSAILIETRDMEGDLRLVRESHGDGVAVHGVGAPRAGAGRVPLPVPRTCGLRPVSTLAALHWGHASHTPWAGNASRTRREHDAAPPGQRYAGRRAKARDPREDGVPIWWPWSVAWSMGEGQMGLDHGVGHPCSLVSSPKRPRRRYRWPSRTLVTIFIHATRHRASLLWSGYPEVLTNTPAPQAHVLPSCRPMTRNPSGASLSSSNPKACK